MADHQGDTTPHAPLPEGAEQDPARPEEEVADAARESLDGYAASPRPVDGNSEAPTPDMADPGYRPPAYPIGEAPAVSGSDAAGGDDSDAEDGAPGGSSR